MEHVKVIVAAFIICGSESKKEQFTFAVVCRKKEIYGFSHGISSISFLDDEGKKHAISQVAARYNALYW